MIELHHSHIQHPETYKHVGRITFLCTIDFLLLILSLICVLIVHSNCEWHINLGAQINVGECSNLREMWTFNAAVCCLMLLLFPILYIIPSLKHRHDVFVNVHSIFTLVVIVLIGARIAMMVLH